MYFKMNIFVLLKCTSATTVYIMNLKQQIKKVHQNIWASFQKYNQQDEEKG